MTLVGCPNLMKMVRQVLVVLLVLDIPVLDLYEHRQPMKIVKEKGRQWSA